MERERGRVRVCEHTCPYVREIERERERERNHLTSPKKLFRSTKCLDFSKWVILARASKGFQEKSTIGG